MIKILKILDFGIIQKLFMEIVSKSKRIWCKQFNCLQRVWITPKNLIEITVPHLLAHGINSVPAIAIEFRNRWHIPWNLNYLNCFISNMLKNSFKMFHSTLTQSLNLVQYMINIIVAVSDFHILHIDSHDATIGSKTNHLKYEVWKTLKHRKWFVITQCTAIVGSKLYLRWNQNCLILRHQTEWHLMSCSCTTHNFILVPFISCLFHYTRTADSAKWTLYLRQSTNVNHARHKHMNSCNLKPFTFS